MNQTTTSLLSQMMDTIGECFTPEVAAKIAALRAPEELNDRLQYLAERCNEGRLTDEERSEYETYAHAFDFIGILQARARKVLKREAAR